MYLYIAGQRNFRVVTAEKTTRQGNWPRASKVAIFGRIDAAEAPPSRASFPIRAGSAHRSARMPRARRASVPKPFTMTPRRGLDLTPRHHRRDRSHRATKTRRPEMIRFHLLIRQHLTLIHFCGPGVPTFVANIALICHNSKQNSRTDEHRVDKGATKVAVAKASHHEPAAQTRPLHSGFGPTTFQRWCSKSLSRSSSSAGRCSESASTRPPAAAGV
jgi:hypothetical protein